MAVLIGSMLGTYALLLVFSKRYRTDTVEMFRLEKSTIRVAVENPVALIAHLLSFIVPLWMMGLL
ncbi:hypothetical protein [Ruegeria sp. HKCCD6119]|uniref:hypothetical protein n=1 Tax=Ruegeria sp. HKCCD6119 TaxID=2683003 RepID=UPI001490AC98|nr:hypothetical protein [Ruegeria sp. HKCCD6119]NOD84070.1 hypothetical protein [Ruegeria sp. HKCCD6119]